MLTYIKNPYVSPVDGITNTETGWKVTSDIAGLNIIEEIPLSADNINMYESDLAVPVGTSVYLWYKLKLSNGEIKDYVGPYEYVSRDSNITSDIKPITRVKTPSITYDKDSIVRGDNLLVLESSAFNGDALDGHLSSTWIIKTLDDRIITYKPTDTDNKYSLTLNKQSLGLNKYRGIKVYLRHHSSNGAISELSCTTVDLSLYPFTFVGNQVVNNKMLYTFRLIPVNQLNHNIDKIDVLHNDEKIISIGYNTNNEYSISAYTLQPNKVYTIRVYILDTEQGKYPSYMDLSLTTVKDISTTLLTDIVYPPELVSIGKSVPSNVSFIGKTVNNKLMTYDNTISRFKLMEINKLNDSLTLSNQLIGFTEHINNSDYKIFNLSTSRFLVITKLVNNTIKIVQGMIVNGNLVRDLTTPIITIPTSVSANANISNIATLSEDEKTLYLVYKTTTIIKFVSISLVTGVETVLTTPPELTLANYSNSANYAMCMLGDDKVVFFNHITKFWSMYNVKESIWIKIGVYPSYITASPRVIALADRSILLLSNTSNMIVKINKNLSLMEFESTVLLNNYNVVALDSSNTLYGYSTASQKSFIYEPTSI